MRNIINWKKTIKNLSYKVNIIRFSKAENIKKLNISSNLKYKFLRYGIIEGSMKE